ncbi:hypothetical protein Q6272_32970, partial [Klebsiella pneumoniae]|nr:hypothetical protein [Klebsiella pneumoniae]
CCLQPGSSRPWVKAGKVQLRHIMVGIIREDPAAVNVSSRYSAHYGANREVLGINNIELITDRSLEINLREITQVKKDWP